MQLYTRFPERLRSWLERRALPTERLSLEASSAFGGRACDAVVNLVGAGDPRLVVELGQDILPLSAEWDGRVLDVVRRRPSTRYVFFSSGVATGHDFAVPWVPGSALAMPPPHEPYARAKAIAERGHRALHDLAIADLRLYSLYSAEMGDDLAYLMCQVIRNVATRQTLVTDQHNIVRDFLHPRDLAAALSALLVAPPCNRAFDLASRAPVAKFDLLRHFQERHGLDWRVEPRAGAANKPNYFATGSDLAGLGFAASATSLEAVEDEAAQALRQRASS